MHANVSASPSLVLLCTTWFAVVQHLYCISVITCSARVCVSPFARNVTSTSTRALLSSPTRVGWRCSSRNSGVE